MSLSVLLQRTFLSNPDGTLWDILCIIITENILLREKCAATVHSIYFLGLKGETLAPSDANLALGARCCTVIHSNQYSASLNTSAANGFLKIYIFT